MYGADTFLGVVEAEEDMVLLMQYAHGAGYTFYDTAPIYGKENEQYLGKAVAPFRGEIAIAKKEYTENVRPELTARVKNMDEYEIVIVAFPNWWTTMPMALFTFLESYDFSGKVICPLITHGGSGFSNSLNDIARLCPSSTIKEGLAINGDDVVKSDKALEKWVKKLGIS